MNQNMENTGLITVYTDGACRGNPGPGGWAALLMYQDHEKVVAGYHPETTNNRMEMMAAIEGLKALKKPSQVRLITDSLYVRDGITRWLPNWRANAWRKADKSPVKNADLWQELEKLTQNHTIEWVWVRGHDGNHGNERVDALARQQISLNSIAQTVGAPFTSVVS